jgi:asparagine synthase (glutamine-hydrolysing)
VTRTIAGVLDRGRRPDASRLAAALAPARAQLIGDGPLRVGYSGELLARTDPICLLDGRLDNAQELAQELGASPEADAEELLASGYRRWGEGLLPRLRGDFVVLLWDPRRAEGLLARDQLGVRCLYVHDASGPLYFANEVCHLLALLPRRPAPDRAGVAHWLTASSPPGSGTLFAGIRRLQPGGLLRLGAAGASEHCYWRPRFVDPQAADELQSPAEMREAIAAAVRRRLAPCERITAVLMSGGLDSSSVAALAVREAPERVETYSGVFPRHPAVDESELVARLRGELGVGGARAEVQPGGLLASALESQLAWQLPSLSWGDFWTLPLLRTAARRGASVVLGGDGGDELFDVRAYLMADRLRRGDVRGVLGLAHMLPGADRPPRRELYRVAATLAIVGALPHPVHEALRTPLRGRALPSWLRRCAAAELRASEDPLAWKRLDGPRWWAHAAHGLSRGVEAAGVFELHRHRAALAGIEARHPLLDLDLVELVLRQQPLSSFDRHLSRPALRDAMAGLLPDAVRLRRHKALFDSLVVDTLAGPDRRAVRLLLDDRRAELGAYVDLDAVRETLLDGTAIRSASPFRWMQQVWRLTTAECWLRAQADPHGQEPRGGLRASIGASTGQASRARVRVHEDAPRSDARRPDRRASSAMAARII